MATLWDLLSRGYFPRELPPPFTTRHFADWALKHVPCSSWKPPDDFSCGHLGVHNQARVGTLRRKLSIPGPFWQALVAESIAANWADVTSMTVSTDSLSKSSPTVAQAPQRSLLPGSGVDLPALRSHARVGARFILRCDVSLYYHSLYTHSVPWAIHGKTTAKARKRDSSLWGNELDRHLRNQQDGQTLGIPIGPDTSLVVAELVLGAVDREFAGSEVVRGFRFMDDYEFGVQTYDAAEKTASELQTALDAFELQLNPRKTFILELPQPAEDPWPSELRTMGLRTSPRSQARDLIRLFDHAFTMARRHPNSVVVKYALGIAAKTKIDSANWELYQSLVLQALLVEPGTSSEALSELQKHSSAGASVDRVGLEGIVNAAIRRHAPLGHGSEVAWAIWTAIVFSLKLEVEAADAIDRLADPVAALLALDAQHSGLFRSPVSFPQLQNMMTAEELWGSGWLLAYEADFKSWLPAPAKHVDADPWFALLKTGGVHFYQRPTSEADLLAVRAKPATVFHLYEHQ